MRSKQEKRLNQAKRASLVIGLSGLLSKILAATYRIPYQNLVGDRGFFAYQQIYPFLAIISTLALTGFPNLISSLIQKKIINPLGQVMTIISFFSWTAALLLTLFSQPLAVAMGVIQLRSAFLSVAALLFVTPFLSLYRGLDQGQGQMTATAISQVLEQTIRVLLILVAALCYVIGGWDIYQTATLAAWGNFLASLVSFFYLTRKVSLKSAITFDFAGWSEILSLSLPSLVFTLYSVYLLLLQLIDAFWVKNSLVRSGLSVIEAESQKGIYDRGQPLIQFGLVVLTALFTSYLPKLTSLYEEDQQAYHQVNRHFFSLVYYLSLTISLGAFSLLPLINQVLFRDNQGQAALQIYLFLIFLASLVQACHQHYFILGRHGLSLAYLGLGLLAKLFLTGPLTLAWGLVGSSLSSLLSLFLVLLAYLLGSWRDLDLTVFGNVKYYLSLAGMVLFLYLMQLILPSTGRLTALAVTLLSAGLGGTFFLGMSYYWQVFPEDLWSFLPFFKKK